MPSHPRANPCLLLCHRCGTGLTPGEGSFWVARIEAFADPTPPTITGDEDIEAIGREIDELLRSLPEKSEREHMDDVYRRLTVHLCGACYRKWIEDPVGTAR